MSSSALQIYNFRFEVKAKTEFSLPKMNELELFWWRESRREKERERERERERRRGREREREREKEREGREREYLEMIYKIQKRMLLIIFYHFDKKGVFEFRRSRKSPRIRFSITFLFIFHVRNMHTVSSSVR